MDTGKKWVIGKYLRTIEKHTEKYCTLDFKFKASPERTRVVPTTSYFIGVGNGGWTFAAVVRPGYIRPVTEETLAEIARLQGEIKAKDAEAKALRLELRALCT